MVGMGAVLVLTGVAVGMVVEMVGMVGSLVEVMGMAQRVSRICILLLGVNRSFRLVVLQHALLQLCSKVLQVAETKKKY